MLGTLNQEEIEEVLTKNIIGRLGCHYNGRTYVVPISYAYDGESIYAISREGQKLNMMRKNPKVCFEVDTLKDLANWKSVITWGVFQELKEKEERSKALSFLLNRTLPLVSSVITHVAPTWPFLNKEDLEGIKGVVFKLNLTEKTGRFEDNHNAPKIFTE